MGFKHFDGSDRENFYSALLLLCLESDKPFRESFVKLLLNGLGLTHSTSDYIVAQVGREAFVRLEDDEEEENSGRTDIWLYLKHVSDEEHDLAMVIEVKTHCNWNPDRVWNQVEKYRGTSIRQLKRPIDQTFVLAPQRLAEAMLERLSPQGEGLNSSRVLSWRALIVETSHLVTEDGLLALAHEHFRRLDAAPVGINLFSNGISYQQFVSGVGVVVLLLRDVVHGLGMKGKEIKLDSGNIFKIHCPHLGGGLYRNTNHDMDYWEISIPFTVAGEKWWIGVYKYDRIPGRKLESLTDPYLELYPPAPNAWISVSFKLSDLDSPDGRNRIKEDFLTAWRQR